jgi:hypothetical protein
MTPQLATQLDAAIAAYALQVAKNKAVAQDAGGWWASLIGADSAAAAVKSAAHSQGSLLDGFKAQRAKVYDDAAGLELLRKVNAELADPLDLKAIADSLTVTGAAQDVATAIAKDVAAGVKAAVSWGAWVVPLALVAVVLFFASRIFGGARGSG